MSFHSKQTGLILIILKILSHHSDSQLNLGDTFCGISWVYWCFYVLASTKERKRSEIHKAISSLQ